jgi:hypothetical protein
MQRKDIIQCWKMTAFIFTAVWMLPFPYSFLEDRQAQFIVSAAAANTTTTTTTMYLYIFTEFKH